MSDARIDGHEVVGCVRAAIDAMAMDGVRPDLVVLTSAAAEAVRGLATQLVDAGGDMTVCGLEVEVYDPPVLGGSWGSVTTRKAWEWHREMAGEGRG